MNAASVELNNGSWLVAGGIDTNYWKMDTVEYTDEAVFQLGEKLPEFVYNHCVVRLDDTRLLLAAGSRDPPYTK